jgi:hypothetical protein
MKIDIIKTPIRVEKVTLAPLDHVPLRLHHRLFYFLAMEMFGKARHDGLELSDSLKDNVIQRLKAIREEHLGDRSWDATLQRAASAAYDATRTGKNHVYDYHSQTEGEFYTFLV